MGWDGLLPGNMFQKQNLELDVDFCYNRNAKHVPLDMGPHVGWQCEGPQVDYLWRRRILRKVLLEAEEQINCVM